ncbi:PAS domain-containing sensor histidine kinase [Clostridium perfringens]|nr:PAS domain-containing sensor histidine kinase [Clostridium perfringens]
MDNKIFFHIFNDDKNKFKTRKTIKFSILIVFSMFFIFLLDLIYKIFNEPITRVTLNANIPIFTLHLTLILGAMAYISSLIYYSSTKKDDFFIISLIYMNLSVELLITKGHNLIIFDKFIFIHSLFRIFILFYVAFNKNGIPKIITKHKIITSVSVFIFSTIIPMINYRIFSNNPFTKDMYFYLGFMTIIVTLYFIACIFISIKSLKDVELIYSFIVASILSISLRGIYWICEVIFPNIASSGSNNIVLLLTNLSFLLAISGVFNEITTKNRKSSLLQNELQVFYHLVEFNTSSSIILYDNTKKVIYTNKTLRERYCKSTNLKSQLEEIERLFDDAIFIGNDNEKLAADSLFNKGDWEGKLILKNNKIVSLYIQILNVENKDYYAINLKDITEEYTLTQDIQRNEQLLSCINNNIQDLIISVDNNGIITYVNDSVLNTLNYTYEEVSGISIRHLLGKNDEILNQLKLEEDDSIKCKLVGKHSFVYVESIIRNLSDNNGVPYGKVIVAKNLTSKRRLENLAVKFKEAKAYEQVKNEFFANISHELRTPLNIIYSTVQLLNSKHEKEPDGFNNFYEKYKRGLKINCYRMLRLINNLIDVSKIEVGFLEADFTNRDIVLLVENIVSSVIPHADNKSISITFDTNVEENIIKCDPVKIERLVLNLLSNSIKFTSSKGEIFVDLNVSEDWVKISVKDNGMGIPKEMQASIFDRFVQADKSLKRRNEGSGIGLSIVKSISELHDGMIELISDGTSGTEIIVWLPNKKLDYTEESNNLVDYITDDKNIELELSDIYEVH